MEDICKCGHRLSAHGEDGELPCTEIEACPRTPEDDLIDVAFRVYERHTAEKHDGYLIDAMTANAVITVYRALRPDLRVKMRTMHVPTVVAFCWKHVKVG